VVVVVAGFVVELDGATGVIGGLEQAAMALTAATSSPSRCGDPDDLDTAASSSRIEHGQPERRAAISQVACSG
jgi:hypothetical protein